MKVNKSAGNMFKGHHTHNSIGGGCRHECIYCYVKDFTIPFLKERYSGDIRLIPEALKGKTGTGKTIFVCNCNDMFQQPVKSKDIDKILAACNEYPDNTYLFQSKNPTRMLDFLDKFPRKSILGTTIETDNTVIVTNISKAPSPIERAIALEEIKERTRFRTQLTIEPVLKFEKVRLLKLVSIAKPDIIYIGADSGENKLPEPTSLELQSLIGSLQDDYPDVRLKVNLSRILGVDLNG